VIGDWSVSAECVYVAGNQAVAGVVRGIAIPGRHKSRYDLRRKKNSVYWPGKKSNSTKFAMNMVVYYSWRRAGHLHWLGKGTMWATARATR
jgi:hypothetical protein